MKSNFISRINKKVSIYLECFATYLEILRKRNRNVIFLFGSPRHPNMGDQAQTYCIQLWVKKNYPNYGMIVFNYYTAKDFLLSLVRKVIKPSDMIFFHSGYHITDLYPEKEVYCKVVKLFPDYKILIFPQTINFVKNEEDEKYVERAFNKHNNIVLCCRDDVSYSKAQASFGNCKLLLYPDIVTSLIGKRRYEKARVGVLFCLRNDIEAFYSEKKLNDLIGRFSVKTLRTDTTIQMPYSYIKKHREQILNDMFDEFASFKLVITDRYHGTIFSLIAGTPVVVISSTDHKLSSGVKWFPASFSKYVHFANNLDEAYQLSTDILTDNSLDYKLEPYFEKQFYSKLKDKYETL